MADDVLIVGGGQAAVQIAASLRELGWTAPITIAGDEAHPPYQRPPLSKAFLSGTADSAALEFRSADFYERERITLLTSRRVTRLHQPASGQPGIAEATDGERLSFAHLAIATGARPRRLEVPGADLEGILYLHDIADATKLRDRLEAARQVLVVGGGFIGLEAAAAAIAKGKQVTIVSTTRLLGRVVAPIMSEFDHLAHERRGVRILLDETVTRFEGTGREVSGAQLTDGDFVPADLVVIGIGAVPRTELAEQLGLEYADGIVVDSYARTSDSTIVAAGDCTVTSHPAAADGGRVRLESVAHAVDQAKCAAATIAGTPTPYDAVPCFWSDQGTLKLQIAGLSAGFDQTVVRGDPGKEKFSVFYYREGRLLAVDAVNSPRDYMAVRRALTAGQQITPDDAADLGKPVRPVSVSALYAANNKG